MKDLCTQTGLGRQAVHFYIQQGLLPEGQKTGRNMAYYSQEHVERLLLIRRLQEEHFLPLKAIRAVLDAYDEDDAFSAAQRKFLDAVKQKLRPALVPQEEVAAAVAPLLARLKLSQEDFAEFVETGLVVLAGEAKKSPTRKNKDAAIRASDVWLLELFSELRHLGYTRALGFTPRDLSQLDEMMTKLFRKEKALLTQRLAHLPAATVALLVKQALPYMNTLLVRLHEAKLRDFLAEL
jgi:DNA-binding transcriptional MerR regulator